MSNEAPRTMDEFRSFFRTRYNPTVRRLMARESRLAQADAEDVVAAAFQETAQWWTSVRDPEAFLWDRVIKRHVDFWRKQQALREVPCEMSEKIVVQTAPKDGEPEHCVGLLRLNELIGQLSTDDQRVIAMDYFGATAAQQAKELGTTEQAARVRLHRAKKRLQKLVTQETEVRR
ncbi:sigma factor-like helix-turn-helix DNA-binding protein [Streptomyces sp. NPDC047043]|uniref:RNA polymerase sigma factor n=1 Tax=Streptomyces sp. NPDC047043 TaxID=3154497 RepID=UPI0033F5B1E5